MSWIPQGASFLLLQSIRVICQDPSKGATLSFGATISGYPYSVAKELSLPLGQSNDIFLKGAVLCDALAWS
eukprot:7862117-Ditylum_brightwellii.AAC.1